MRATHNERKYNCETPADGSAFFALFVLFVVNLCGYLDRHILSLLVQPIRASLGISDTMIGVLQGLAFVVTFSLAGLFMGHLVDRHDRRRLLIICVAIWTMATVLSGLVTSGGQLFVARMFVGIGEAALLPAAVSLIADYFDEDRRGGALGFFVTGTHMGIGVSLVVVGMALHSLTSLSDKLAQQGAALVNFALVATWVVGLLALASLAPARSRGNITAILLLTNGLLGQAAGPAAIGILSDMVGGEEWPLSRILGMVGAVACIISFLCFLLARYHLQRRAR